MYELFLRKCQFLYEAQTLIYRAAVDSYATANGIPSDKLDEEEHSFLMVHDVFVKACMLEVLMSINDKFLKEQGDLIDNLFKYGNLFSLIEVNEAIELALNGKLYNEIIVRVNEALGMDILRFYVELLDKNILYKEAIVDSIVSMNIMLTLLRGDTTDEQDDKIYNITKKYFGEL